jgi:hypothetical protein
VRTYEFRHHQWAWGIAVDLTAEVARVEDRPSLLRPIVDGLWFDRGGARSMEVPHLLFGFDLMAPRLAQLPQGSDVIRVENTWWNPTDFQPEGLTIAAILWTCEEFDLEPPPMNITFMPRGVMDTYPNGRYLFDWGIDYFALPG